MVADLDNDGLKDIFSLHEQVLLYKPGAITDTLEPNYRPVLERGGQIYADTAIQVFKNRGNRAFEEISPASSSSMLGRRYYLSIIPLDLNGDGFLDIVGGYWTKGYDKQRGGLKGTTVFLNDGTGAFQTIDGSVLFPVKAANRAAVPEQLGIFVPTRLASDRLDGLFITSSNWNNSGTLTARKGYYKGAIGTGPGLADSARLGFPGYNEFYYLRTHPDAAAAVESGQYQNGLGHYKAVGVRRGYQAFAANATIRGSVGSDTLILPIRMQDARISVIEGGWRRLVDTTRKYGTLQIRGVERIQFLDGVKGL